MIFLFESIKVYIHFTGIMNTELSNDPFVDQVVIKTEPRFKTSHLSGNEWRFSYRVLLYRKGKIIHDEEYCSMDNAMRSLAMRRPYNRITPKRTAYFETRCMNPGCTKKATVKYKLVKQGCSHCGHVRDRAALKYCTQRFRQFCKAHAHRGDASLDDSMDNYAIESGTPSTEDDVPAEVVSKAVFGGFI